MACWGVSFNQIPACAPHWCVSSTQVQRRGLRVCSRTATPSPIAPT